MTPVPILYWHHIGDAPTRALRPYAVAPSRFTDQLDALVDAGFETVTFDDVRAGRLPPRPVVLTFDDGYRSFVEHAAPALAARDLRAVVFVVAGALGGVNSWDRGADGLRLVDEDEVRAIAAAGHEIGAHGWRHDGFPERARSELLRELLGARALLEALVGRPVRSLSYPYGRCDDRVVDVVRECGFDLAFLDARQREPGWEPALSLTRIEVTPDRDASALAAGSGVAIEPVAGRDVPAFERLVDVTLAAAPGHAPAAAWAAVHRHAEPLASVLAVRAPATVAPIREFVKDPATAGSPVARVLAPLADELDARLERTPHVPVFDAATPDEVRDPSGARLGAWGTDLVRLLWTLPPEDGAATTRAYLRAMGRSTRRRDVTAALDDITLAELALVCDDARDGVASTAQVEQALAALPDHDAVEPAVERGDDASRVDRLLVATAALVRQRLREHYRGSLLGVAWAAAQPVSLFAVLAVVFGGVVPLGIRDYPAFLIAGLVPWLFVQRSIGDSVAAVRGQGHLLRLSAFPRLALPLAVVAAAGVDLLAQLVIVLPVLAVLGHGSLTGALALVPLAAGLLAFALAASLLVGGLSVRYRDVGHAVPVLVGIAFYLVPVLYPASRIPSAWRVVYRLDPAAVFVEAFRAAAGTGPWPPAWAVAVTAVTTAAALAGALRWFDRRTDDLVAQA